MSSTFSIINNANNKKEQYNILTFVTHERFETDLCKTGHNFYAFSYPDATQWNKKYADVPENYYILPENTLYGGLDFDFIFACSKFGHLQTAHQLKQHLQLPVVSFECTVPTPIMPPAQIESMKNMKGDYNLFVTEYQQKAWEGDKKSQVIPHGIDTDVFCLPEDDSVRKSQVLSVVNDFVNRDYCCNYQGWKRITEDLPVKLVGNTPGVSEAASSTEELIKEYQSSSIFLNTSTFSPIPTSLMEAMACGCAPVTTETCGIPKFIEHGVNGFISNSESELKEYTKELLNNEQLARDMGLKARQTIEEVFSMKKFISNWNGFFGHVVESNR